MPDLRTSRNRARRKACAERNPGAAGRSKPRASGAVWFAAAWLLLAACSGSSTEAQKPVAALAVSLDAERDVRKLVSDWSHASREERMEMASRIDALRAQHPTDPGARIADVLSAWIDLERGDLQGAEDRAEIIERRSGTGTIADIARTVRGAARRREGEPKEALSLLSPLVSKLIDPWARALLNEEIVESATLAGEWRRALELMSVWLREAGLDERATVRGHIEHNLTRVPQDKLETWLKGERRIELAAAAEEELEIQKLVAQRLAVLARETKNAELAHTLLATSGNLLGEQSDAVAKLAAGANRARVEARTVGLLLSLRDAKTRRRGAEIATGVAFGLGLPGSPARLVSRDDHGSAARIEEALTALAADGAAIVIAGSDEREAGVAAAFAESRQIPVILLRAPAVPPPVRSKTPFSFVLGLDLIELESSLVKALAARGATPIAVLADEPVGARAPREHVSFIRGCSEASSPWRPLGVAGVVLSAQPECARAAIVAAAPQRLRFAASFEADAAGLPHGSVVATAGLFPIALGDKPKTLASWLTTHPTPPSFWEALGRDAATLAWAGVQALPPRGTEDPTEVALRRAMAAAALASAKADLWTTDAKGFGGARAMPRTIGVRDVKR
jgi:hypothetical protein